MTVKHSYSAVKTFNTCPRQYEALYILRNVPRKSSPALEKGIAWHKALEDALLEAKPLPSHLVYWQPLADMLHKAGAEAEVQLAITHDKTPTDFKAEDVWVRGAIDVRLSAGNKITMLDWKTGKVYPDSLQADFYATMQWAQTPGVKIEFHFTYLEHKRTVPVEVDKKAPDRVYAALERIENTTTFHPRPCFACKFCPVSTCEYWKGE